MVRLRDGLAAAVLAIILVACGGGSESTSKRPARGLVGEIFSAPAEIASAEIVSSAGYSGNTTTSHAIQAAGKQNLLDMLFLFPAATPGGRVHDRLADDAEPRLASYAVEHASLLVPGIRVLVLDEAFWDASSAEPSVAGLQAQLDALVAAVALVRKHVPQAAIGITVTPYATFGRPRTLQFVTRALEHVDWVATDPYWFGDAATIGPLHDWSGRFHRLAKQANPAIETWFVAQAFKLAAWDTPTFNAFIAEQLAYAEQYDNIMFFGWQFVSEVDAGAAGRHFPPETKQLYRRYLRPG